MRWSGSWGPLLPVLLWGCAGVAPGGPGEGTGPPSREPPGGADPWTGLDSVPPLPIWEPAYGQEVRATVGTFPPFVGEVQGLSGEVLLLREGAETYPLRLPSIRRLEVRRYRRTRAAEGGFLGAVLGGLIGRVTLIGIGGEHWESQGRILAPGLGAIMGGLVGALLGGRFGGDFWEEVTIPPDPRLAPRRIVDPLPAPDGAGPGPRSRRDGE